jgi:hypothetical protein
LTVLGDNPVYVSDDLWGTFNDQEAACYDPIDGHLGMKKGDFSSVDMKIPGTYRVTYKCQNLRGIIGYATRMIIVEKANGKHVTCKNCPDSALIPCLKHRVQSFPKVAVLSQQLAEASKAATQISEQLYRMYAVYCKHANPISDAARLLGGSNNE